MQALPIPPVYDMIISFIGAFLGILWVAGCAHALDDRLNEHLLVASLGATAVLIYGPMESKLAQPRNVIGNAYFDMRYHDHLAITSCQTAASFTISNPSCLQMGTAQQLQQQSREQSLCRWSCHFGCNWCSLPACAEGCSLVGSTACNGTGADSNAANQNCSPSRSVAATLS